MPFMDLAEHKGNDHVTEGLMYTCTVQPGAAQNMSEVGIWPI